MTPEGPRNDANQSYRLVGWAPAPQLWYPDRLGAGIRGDNPGTVSAMDRGHSAHEVSKIRRNAGEGLCPSSSLAPWP